MELIKTKKKRSRTTRNRLKPDPQSGTEGWRGWGGRDKSVLTNAPSGGVLWTSTRLPAPLSRRSLRSRHNIWPNGARPLGLLLSIAWMYSRVHTWLYWLLGRCAMIPSRYVSRPHRWVDTTHTRPGAYFTVRLQDLLLVLSTNYKLLCWITSYKNSTSQLH